MIRLAKASLAALALTAVLAAGACSPKAAPDKAPEAGDIAVAKVGDRTVWSSDVKREAVAQGLIGEGEPLDASSPLFHQVLDGVVDQKLLAAEAVKRKLDSDPAAQRRLAAARERILGDILVENAVEKAVNDNAIRNLYQELQRSNHSAEEYHARQIVMPTAADADTIKKQIGAGASFEQLAMTRSIDTATRFSGGDLGYFTTDVMPEGYAAALKGAKAGQVVGPFAIDGGFVVLKVEDVRPEQPITLDAARPQIVKFLTYAEVKDLLDNLRKGAKVTMLIKPLDGPERAREPDAAPGAQVLAPQTATPPAPQSPATPAPATPALPSKPASKP